MWIFLGFVLLALYLLFIKGILWKLIFLAAGWGYIYITLEKYIPDSKLTVLTFLNCNISWSIFIPSLLVIFAMATTRVKDD